MSEPSSRCDPAALRRLLDGGVPEPLRAELIAHLDRCESCRVDLEGMAAGERWWEDARRFVGVEAGPGPDPVVPHRAETISMGHGADETAGPVEDLGFLSPSASPGSLGRLGPYEILGLLGRGGMGLVLRGHDPALNRPVAVKVLYPPSAAGPLGRKRFSREARAAAAVVHENVVAIHAVDEAGGVPYLVMQYVAGRSLQERIDRDGPLRVEEVLRIGMQAASGLAAAHAQGLVHRDVKPSNILLENGVERVKLTDFGLARAVDDAGLTHCGVVAGTPQYMAPEQARGESVDHRSDLFGLGSVLYAMCSGHAPFRADSTLAVMRRISEEQPRPVRQINPEIPEWLEAIIARLHEKEPAARYQSAAEVAEILAAHLAHLQEPGRQAPSSSPHDAPKPVADPARPPARSRVLILLGACGVAGFVGLAWAIIAAGRSDRGGPRPPGEGPFPRAAVPSAREVAPATPTGPPRTIVGVVRDHDSGEPIPGVRLTLAGLPVEATTDDSGRYELRGPANARDPSRDGGLRFELAVEPAGLPFLAANVEVAGVEGDDTIHSDISLCRGIPFRIRLADGATRGLVRSAKVVYRPLHPNPFVEGAIPRGGSGLHCRAVEGPDGTYAGVMLPGPGAIGVESYAEHYGPASVDPVASFVPGSSAPEGIDASTVYGTRRLLAVEMGGDHGVYYWPQDQMSAILLVDPKMGQDPVERELILGNRRPKGHAP
jgi:serine/threonine-protein kinase